MAVDIGEVLGLVFTSPDTGEQFGVIRERAGAPTATADGWRAWAEDECGNAFVVCKRGAVGFRDHETGQVRTLAHDWPAFVAGCAEPTDAALDPDQVEDVWISPSLAQQHGIDVDDAGRPRQQGSPPPRRP